MMKLISTSKRFEMKDEASGYSFTINAEDDAEYGWGAEVKMQAFGMKTPEAAVRHLRFSAEAFLKQLAEEAE